MLAFFPLDSNEIVLLLTKEKEEEWLCFIQEANFHFIDKQVLIYAVLIRLPLLVLTVKLFKINNDID